jgi:hypothetical protein
MGFSSAQASAQFGGSQQYAPDEVHKTNGRDARSKGECPSQYQKHSKATDDYHSDPLTL